MLTFSLIGIYISINAEVTNKKIWLLSVISAFFVNLYSGTIGAIFGEYIVRSRMETIVIDDTLKWGVVYAFILLPFTVLVAAVFEQKINAVFAFKIFDLVGVRR